VTTFLDEMARALPLLTLGSGQATKRLCLEEQNAQHSALWLEGFCVGTEQLNEHPHTKPEGWNLALCLGCLQKS